MRNENILRCASRPNIFGNGLARQASVALPSKKERNRWNAPVTAEYLKALREADELVFGAILRGVALRHSGRVLKA